MNAGHLDCNPEGVREMTPPGDLPEGVRWIADQIIREFSLHQKALDKRLERVEQAIERLSENVGKAEDKLDEVNRRCEKRGEHCLVMENAIANHQKWIDFTKGKLSILALIVPTGVVVLWELIKAHYKIGDYKP